MSEAQATMTTRQWVRPSLIVSPGGQQRESTLAARWAWRCACPPSARRDQEGGPRTGEFDAPGGKRGRARTPFRRATLRSAAASGDRGGRVPHHVGRRGWSCSGERPRAARNVRGLPEVARAGTRDGLADPTRERFITITWCGARGR